RAQTLLVSCVFPPPADPVMTTSRPAASVFAAIRSRPVSTEMASRSSALATRSVVFVPARKSRRSFSSATQLPPTLRHVQPAPAPQNERGRAVVSPGHARFDRPQGYSVRERHILEIPHERGRVNRTAESRMDDPRGQAEYRNGRLDRSLPLRAAAPVFAGH